MRKIVLTDCEWRIASGIGKQRDAINAARRVTDQACSVVNTPLSVCAEWAIAKLFNVYPPTSWEEYDKFDLTVKKFPVDVKLQPNKTGDCFNIRWNDKHKEAPFNTLYAGAHYIGGTSFIFVGMVNREQLTEQHKNIGTDNCPYYQIPFSYARNAWEQIKKTTPQFQSIEQWLKDYQ